MKKVTNKKLKKASFNKSCKTVCKTLSFLVELSARTVSGFVLVTQFEQVYLLVAGIYLLITAGLMIVAVVAKASKE